MITHWTGVGEFNPRQYGFIPGRGTHTAIALIYEYISQSRQSREQVNVVQRDVSKAFDRVWHTGLKNEMLDWNVTDSMRRLLCSFLDDRTAQIRIGRVLGPKINIKTGVPQGSCASPSIYIQYTKDTPVPEFGEQVAFADDITQIVTDKSRGRSEYVTIKTVLEAKKVNEHEESLRIKTNLSKFKVIPFGCERVSLEIDDNEIEYSNSGQVLGFTLSTMGIGPHITRVAGRAHIELTKLNKFKNTSQNTKLTLYRSLIRPILEYPPVPHYVATEAQMLKLQRVQNRALRFITGTEWSDFRTNASLHEELNLEPLNIRIHGLAKKTWERVERIGGPIFDSLRRDDEENQIRSLPRSMNVPQEPPEPLYR